MKAVAWLTSGIVTSPFFPGRLRNVVIRKWCGGGIQSNKLKVGEGPYFNENCKVYNQHGTVELGNDVAVAFGVYSLQQPTIIPTRPTGPARCLVVTSK